MTDAARTDSSFGPTERAAAAMIEAAPQRGYLFGPLTDFVYLGGGSLVVLGLIAIFLPEGISTPQEISLMTILMLLINQPHFAHSYQMFYRNFRAKAFGLSYAPALRLRYILAGLVVPIALVAFLAAGVLSAIVTKSTLVLGYGLNLMFFLVGWHYVKQGYGILIVDSIQKKLPFSENVKRMLRINSYACWLVTWIGLNNTVAKAAPQIGMTYYTLPLPAPLYRLILIAAIISTAAVLAAFVQCWRRTRTLPWNGVVAYMATLYVWVVFARVNPLVYVVIPTFHSLQYLTVVWRYQLNAASAGSSRKGLAALNRVLPDSVWRRLSAFVLLGIVLGYLGLDGIPRFLDTVLPYDQGIFGTGLFYFSFVIFINVHHYFLDNVMWRRGNPDIQQFLFRGPSAAR